MLISPASLWGFRDWGEGVADLLLPFPSVSAPPQSRALPSGAPGLFPFQPLGACVSFRSPLTSFCLGPGPFGPALPSGAPLTPAGSKELHLGPSFSLVPRAQERWPHVHPSHGTMHTPCARGLTECFYSLSTCLPLPGLFLTLPEVLPSPAPPNAHPNANGPHRLPTVLCVQAHESHIKWPHSQLIHCILYRISVVGLQRSL